MTENTRSLLWVIPNGIASEHGIEHVQIGVLYIIENGGCVFHVLDRTRKKLAQSEGDMVKASLDHKAMDLRGF